MNEKLLDACERSIASAAREGVLLLRAGARPYRGSSVNVAGAERLNFGSCSYLALEVREELKRGAIAAAQKYGTQFPFAKPQLDCALYGELERLLEAMTGGKAVIASSATLAHLAAIPALMSPRDAVVVDRLAHASILMGLRMLENVHVEYVKHNRMDVLAERVEALSKDHERVWYVLDGVYSMSGEFAPAREIAELLARFPKLYLYWDDAHATSWLGKHGRGLALQALPDQSRAVVILSLNKAFSAAGGALIVPNDEIRDRILHAGAAMMFSGPIQPPMLGAAVASAELHLSDEFADMQAALAERIRFVHDLAAANGIKLGSYDHSPIAFIPCGPDAAMYGLFHAVERHGFFIAPAVFPAVAADKAGLRLTVSLHNSPEDTERLLQIVAEEMRAIPEIVEYQASFQPLSAIARQPANEMH